MVEINMMVNFLYEYRNGPYVPVQRGRTAAASSCVVHGHKLHATLTLESKACHIKTLLSKAYKAYKCILDVYLIRATHK